MSNKPLDAPKLSFEEAQAWMDRSWELGHLRWLLYPHQKEIYDGYLQSGARKFVLHCSRRLGKSATLLTLCNEMGRKQKRAIMRYGAAHQKDVHEIIHPLMRILTARCPERIRPVWNQSKGKYIFPETEAELIVSGLDEGRGDNLRGASMNLGIIDEAGFVDDLDYVVRSVLMPQLLTTDGRLILSSTSPRTAGHPFVQLLEEAKDAHAYVKKTIHEDSRPEVLARIPEWCREAGGADSTTWRREYLCEIITDEESSLVPEFTDAKMQAIVKDWPIPPYAHFYTVIDLGLIDYTAAVFGYVDFVKGKNVIQDELLMNHKDSATIMRAVKEKEAKLWGEQTPVRRFADGPALTVYDMNYLHQMNFAHVLKDELDAQVNSLRLEVQSESLIIAPECRQLIRHLKYGVWDRSRRKFDRLPGFGHFDLVAAVMYFVRHTNKRENPYPSHFGLNEYDQFHAEQSSQVSSHEEKALRQIFNLHES